MDTTPGPAPDVQDPKKNPSSDLEHHDERISDTSNCQRRQVGIVAARTQRHPNAQSCICGTSKQSAALSGPRAPASAQQGHRLSYVRQLVLCATTGKVDDTVKTAAAATLSEPRHLSLKTTGTSTTMSRHDLDSRGIDHQEKYTHGRKDHGNRPLHHDKDIDDLKRRRLRDLHSFSAL